MAEQSGRYTSGTEDRLPWLEPVEDDAVDYAVPRSRVFGGVIAALAVIAIVVGGLFWLRQPHSPAAGGEIALISAPAGSYKSRPENPGGMQVAGQGDTAFAASQGADPNAQIDLSAKPETPVKMPAATKFVSAEPAKPVAPAAKPTAVATATAKPAAAPTKPVATPAKPVAPAAKPVQLASKTPTPAAKPSSVSVVLPAAKPAVGPAIQLGAFSSQAKAEAQWATLTGKFASLGGLSKNVVAAAKDDGGTVYRLRASGAGAAAVCTKLKAAGQGCVVVRD